MTHINDLTIAQLKELKNFLGVNSEAGSEAVSKLTDGVIGNYVLVRSRNEGINAGYVKAADSTGVVLKRAIRVYSHRPADRSMSWYEGVAMSGLSTDSRTSPEVPEKVILEDYSLTICCEVARLSIQAHTPNAQS